MPSYAIKTPPYFLSLLRLDSTAVRLRRAGERVFVPRVILIFQGGPHGSQKITVVGAGNVGAQTALWLAQKELGDVLLLDVVEGMPAGKSLDMMQASAIEGFDSNITGSNDFKDIAGSDIVIITAGLARKPGMTRSDLIGKNIEILKGVIGHITVRAPQAIVIVVTNPLDVMVYAAWKLSGLPPERIIGMAGALDSARLRAFIAMELGVSMNDVQAMVIGGHADEMVPLARYSTVSGIPISQFISKVRFEAIMERTKGAGGEIVGLFKDRERVLRAIAAAAADGRGDNKR